MKRNTVILCLLVVVVTAFGVVASLNAQEPSLKRIEVLRVDMAGMEGKEAHMWVAEIAPGAATAKHSHPTPRFVYVMEGQTPCPWLRMTRQRGSLQVDEARRRERRAQPLMA